MRKPLLAAAALAIALVSVLAFAGGDLPAPGTSSTAIYHQTATLTAPTSCDAGLSLVGVDGYRTRLCSTDPTDGGFSYHAGGTLRAYYYDPFRLTDLWDGGQTPSCAKRWSKSAALNWSPVGTVDQCETFQDIQTKNRFGRVFYAVDAVYNDGGSGFDITIDATVLK